MVVCITAIFKTTSNISDYSDFMPGTKNSLIGGPIDELDSLKGWVAVGCAFTSMFICFGVVYSFGAFFDPMSSEFNTSSGATSAIFSITTFIFLTGGIISGMAADRFGPRPVLIFGGLAMGSGLYLTSLINSLWVGYITYGLGVGVGVACGYVPMLAIVGGWFEKHRAAALGVAVTGVGLGTMAVTPLAAVLINHYGWRQTYVIFGIVSVVGLFLCGCLTPRPPSSTEQRSRLHLRELVKMPVFGYLYFSGFFITLALFVPFVFLVTYARVQGIDEVAAASLVGIIGGASIAGRLGFGALGDKISRIHLYQSTFMIVSFSSLIWLFSYSSFTLLIIYAVLLGGGYGGFIVLSPTVAAELFGLVGLGTILGATYTAAGIGGLLGPTLAGYLIDKSGGYNLAIIAAMIFAFSGFLLLIPVGRYLKRRDQEKGS
jgi:MFS family permease